MANEENLKEIKKELKKLKPKDRIKKLKELEERRRVEITQIEYLIKDSEKELITKDVAEEIAPEQTRTDIGKLLEEETEQLERTVKDEAPGTENEELGYKAFQKAYGDYTTLKDIQYASMMGPLTTSQMETIDQIGERIDRTKYRSASQEVADILVASRSALHKIKKYTGM